jgi:hypothetical protein
MRFVRHGANRGYFIGFHAVAKNRLHLDKTASALRKFRDAFFSVLFGRAPGERSRVFGVRRDPSPRCKPPADVAGTLM